MAEPRRPGNQIAQRREDERYRPGGARIGPQDVSDSSDAYFGGPPTTQRGTDGPQMQWDGELLTWYRIGDDGQILVTRDDQRTGNNRPMELDQLRDEDPQEYNRLVGIMQRRQQEGWTGWREAQIPEPVPEQEDAPSSFGDPPEDAPRSIGDEEESPADMLRAAGYRLPSNDSRTVRSYIQQAQMDMGLDTSGELDDQTRAALQRRASR